MSGILEGRLVADFSRVLAGPLVGVALADLGATAKDATIGVLAALHERQASGRGQRVEVNLLGNAHPSIAPYETLRCRDGHVAIACGNDDQFRRLCLVVGSPMLADDPRFATNAARVEHRPALVAALELRLTADDGARWVDLLTAAGVPAGLLGDVASGLALAERLGLRPRVAVEGSAVDQIRHAVTYSRTPVDAYRRPPRLGEHTDSIRSQFTTTVNDSTARKP